MNEQVVTFLVPIQLTSVSREVPGDHYSRKVADVCLPALNRLYGYADGRIPFDAKTDPAHREATAVLMRGHWMRVTAIVERDGNLVVLSVESE